MERDIRKSETYRLIEDYYRALRAPGEERVTDAMDLTVSPDGTSGAFTGLICHDFESAPSSRVCFVDMETGKQQILEHDNQNTRLPRWSPNGEKIAFLSEDTPGNFQLYLADALGKESGATSKLPGMIEYFSWSPDSTKILAGIAGFGADLAGCQGGATTVAEETDGLPDWIPEVDTGDAENLWRDIYVICTETGEARRINPTGLNVWEANWLGNDRVAAVASNSHSEGSWYTAELIEIEIEGNDLRTIFVSEDQIAVPAASPSGQHIAIIEAVCSDRMIVCGTLYLVDRSTGQKTKIDTNETEVTHLIWGDEETLFFAGRRAFETVVGSYSIKSGILTEIWVSAEQGIGAWYPAIWPLADGRVAAIVESFSEPPSIALLHEGAMTPILSLGTEVTLSPDFSNATIEEVRWHGRDGLEIHGCLVRPAGEGPFPVVMNIHGGPVWSVPNRWQERMQGAGPLARLGIATFYPNVRGSSARGQDFARKVKGDMGGEDTYDYLTGLDALVERGIADPDRLGVTGISYGGFMSSWLITQDNRFAAAVPISPVTNWYSQHNTSQIPYFDALFLQDEPYSPGGRYFERSPVMFARNVKTPTLQLTGALDKNTPPTQALEYHRALLEAGVESVLVTYPKAGHGIRNYPDVLDHVSRSVSWFQKYLL